MKVRKIKRKRKKKEESVKNRNEKERNYERKIEIKISYKLWNGTERNEDVIKRKMKEGKKRNGIWK